MSARDDAGPMSEFVRYTLVAVIGLIVDVGIGYLASTVGGLPVIFGAALGFIVGVAINYVLFETWVFRTGRLTLARMGAAYVAAQGAFLVRLAAVAGLGWTIARWAPALPQAKLIQLVLAAGVSFAVNFVLVRGLLRPRARP